MQTMNEKNRAALEQLGARKILGHLANVSSRENAEEFVERYGPLRVRVMKVLDQHDNEVDTGTFVGPFRKFDMDMETEVVNFALKFRTAWAAKTERDAWAVNRFLNDIFSPGLPGWEFPPVMAADFATGRWEPRARTLLDALAIELMRTRKMLARCERPECERYFVKEFSRDRYCSNLCSDEMRRRGQARWVEEHREELRRKRKKTGKSTTTGRKK
jgi:hypothetical protein